MELVRKLSFEFRYSCIVVQCTVLGVQLLSASARGCRFERERKICHHRFHEYGTLARALLLLTRAHKVSLDEGSVSLPAQAHKKYHSIEHADPAEDGSLSFAAMCKAFL
jgi:hypothetical protein